MQYNYSALLGDAVKRARGRTGMTQAQVAEAADIDPRTVLNIENNKGNPKLEVLFPLIRALQIDPREIFYPETQRQSTSIDELRLLVEGFSEEEAATIIPMVKAVLDVLHSKAIANITDTNELKKSLPSHRRKAGSAFTRLALCLIPFLS